MIQLTLLDGNHFLTASDQIFSVSRHENGGAIVIFPEGVPCEVQESVMDVARLKAAWERRYHAWELRGTLPIAVRMNETRDGITFVCCEHTKRLRDERAKKPFWARKKND